MSTKVGIIAEGPIDHALLPALLERISRDRAGFDWPLRADDVAELFYLRKRGHGGVLEATRRLVGALRAASFEHAFFVILLDRNTKAVQQKVRRLVRGDGRFIVAVAIEEIEAWWLADRRCTLPWAGLGEPLDPALRYARPRYRAERDPDPKRTLDELTRASERLDRVYGEGSVDLAMDFAEGFWRRGAHLDDIAAGCPRGFAPFAMAATSRFRGAAFSRGRLF